MMFILGALMMLTSVHAGGAPPSYEFTCMDNYACVDPYRKNYPENPGWTGPYESTSKSICGRDDKARGCVAFFRSMSLSGQGDTFFCQKVGYKQEEKAGTKLCILKEFYDERSSSGKVDSSCADGHFEGRRCVNHKNKADCLSYYNKNAFGTDPIDKICGWSINEDNFGGLNKSNCASAPWVTGKEVQAVADFGACNAQLGGSGGEPTPMPTCGECSEFDGDKSGCKKADPARYCVDACVWNKDKNLCTGMNCSDRDGANNMFKCTKRMRKKFGMECFFDVRDNTCTATNAKVSCDTYNTFSSVKRNIKKGCKKLGKHYNECTFSKADKKCHAAGAKVPCGDIKGKIHCKDGCVYVNENKTCIDA